MTYELITERNLSQGLHILFVYVNDITGGILVNLLLLMIWSIVTFGIYFAQKRTQPNPDFAGSLAVGGFITAGSTILLSLIPGLVSFYTYVIVIVLAMVSILFFFFSKNN